MGETFGSAPTTSDAHLTEGTHARQRLRRFAALLDSVPVSAHKGFVLGVDVARASYFREIGRSELARETEREAWEQIKELRAAHRLARRERPKPRPVVSARTMTREEARWQIESVACRILARLEPGTTWVPVTRASRSVSGGRAS